MFEVQLVLDWLLSLGAVSKTVGGGYQVTSGFWAAFGDRLHDTEDDWFGEHVKRHVKMHQKQHWREKYNLRYSTMKTQTSQQIIQNTRGQYGILQRAFLEPTANDQETIEDLHTEVAPNDPALEATTPDEAATRGSAAHFTPINPPHALGEASAPDADVEMEDVGADVDAEEEDVDADGEVEDVDAEGEVDDEMY
jgi:transcription factor C subunit 3